MISIEKMSDVVYVNMPNIVIILIENTNKLCCVTDGCGHHF